MFLSKSIFNVLVVIVRVEAPRCWFGIFKALTLLSVHNLVVRQGLQRCLCGGDSATIGPLTGALLGADVLAAALLSDDPPVIMSRLLRVTLELHAAGNSPALACALHNAVEAHASQEGAEDQACHEGRNHGHARVDSSVGLLLLLVGDFLGTRERVRLELAEHGVESLLVLFKLEQVLLSHCRLIENIDFALVFAGKLFQSRDFVSNIIDVHSLELSIVD